MKAFNKNNIIRYFVKLAACVTFKILPYYYKMPRCYWLLIKTVGGKILIFFNYVEHIKKYFDGKKNSHTINKIGKIRVFFFFFENFIIVVLNLKK